MRAKGEVFFTFPTLLTVDRVTSRESRGTLFLLATGGWFLYLAAALLNPGIVAMDDYYDGIARFIPAQAHSPQEIIAGAGLRSPLSMLLSFGFAKLLYGFGVTAPRAQFHLTLAILATIGFFVLFLSALAHFERGSADSARSRIAAGFLVGFYFLCPLFFSRAMIESLCAPWLLASSAFACRYWVRPSRGSLLAALLFIGAASLMRFQAGVCVAAMFAVIALRGRWRDLGLALILLLLGFIATGAVDSVLRGEFHGSLKAYVQYNLAHSSDYGEMKWYVFPALFVAMAFPPFLLSRYRGFRPVAVYAPLVPALLYFIVFVVAHSLVPHKEDRFMIPIAPVFLVLMAPVAAYFATRARLGDRTASWRVAIFLLLNGALLALTTFFPPQRAALELADYIQRSPGVTTLLTEEFLLFPQAFVERPIRLKPVAEMGTADCGFVAAVLSPGPVPAKLRDGGWVKGARFEPGPLERLVYELNPKRNARRRAIDLYTPPGCS